MCYLWRELPEVVKLLASFLLLLASVSLRNYLKQHADSEHWVTSPYVYSLEGSKFNYSCMRPLHLLRFNPRHLWGSYSFKDIQDSQTRGRNLPLWSSEPGQGPKRSFGCWLDFVLQLAEAYCSLTYTGNQFIFLWETFYVAATLKLLTDPCLL